MIRIRHLRKLCSLTAVFVVFQLLVLQAMAASGDLHKRFHDHAGESSHECAVTMMLAGGYDSVVPDILPVEFIPEQPPLVVVFPRVVDVAPGHLAGGVLAHAPPRAP